MNVAGVLALARPEIRSFTPYSSARMEAEQAAVMLNANESPWAPFEPDGFLLNRYPEPQPAVLRARLAGFYGVDVREVLVTRGSDEAMDLLVRVFCRSGRDAILICPPTFGLYAVCAALQGAAVVSVPLDADFNLDENALLAALTSAVKLVFVCSPNNPTGGLVPPAKIERLAAALMGRALLVVDEAYIEFADAPSAASLLVRYPNLVVLRTLSKAWALAGARVGALLAHAAIIALLRRILAPYPLSSPSIAVACKALAAPGAMYRRVAALKRERERVAAALASVAAVSEVLPSAANFLTVRFRDAESVWRRLSTQGIVVRDLRRHARLGDALRVSLGTPEQNDALLAALESREVVP